MYKVGDNRDQSVYLSDRRWRWFIIATLGIAPLLVLWLALMMLRQSQADVDATLGAEKATPEALVPIEEAADHSTLDEPALEHAVQVYLRDPHETEQLRQRHRPFLSDVELPPLGIPAYRTKEPLPDQPPGETLSLQVSFQSRHLARAGKDGSLWLSFVDAPAKAAIAKVLAEHGIGVARAHTADDEAITRMEARAWRNTGEMPVDLAGTLQIVDPQQAEPWALDSDRAMAIARAMNELAVVVAVNIESLTEPPPPPRIVTFDQGEREDVFALPGATPSYQHLQTYRGSSGINVDWAWQNHAGARGAGVRLTDVEYDFNPQHEDLIGTIHEQSTTIQYYDNFGDDHGTAVLGVMSAIDNDVGMKGMVPNAETWFIGEHAQVNGSFQSRTMAVAYAASQSDPGDIVVLEMQAVGVGGGNNFVPAEYNSSVWNVVKTATDAGVIIIAAAGNGNQNLDHEDYELYMNRGDSGAIIVGAGSSNSSRNKMSFSTYGSRVNVQGWGQNVATLGYGNHATHGGDHNRKYTHNFSGTSSATPIVASAAASLQGIALELFSRPLTPAQMRQILIDTGLAQGSGGHLCRIYPMPYQQ